MISSRNTWLAAVAFGFLSAMPVAAGAAEFGTTIKSQATSPIVIEVNEGQILRLNREADSIFVANPGVADLTVRSAKMVYVFGKKPGETSLFAVDAEDRVIANTTIVVRHNISRLQSALDNLIPSRSARASSFDGGIILSGVLRSPQEAADAESLSRRFLGEGDALINQMVVSAPNQVNVRVRIAEVAREITEELGFNWDALGSSGNFLFGLATAIPTAGASTLFGSFSSGSFSLDGFVDALEDDGLVSTLAEPNLTALSGETASFLAGGEFPIPFEQNDDGLAIQFKQFGVSLSFTPTILSGNRISMRVRPEVSDLSEEASVSFGASVIPGITTRRADTTVEMASGQSFAIAGMLRNNLRQSVAKIPGLGDIPILGELFKSNRFARNETELVIIVTPYIVEPAAVQMARPTEPFEKQQTMGHNVAGYRSAADTQEFIPLQNSNANAAANSSAGFIIE